MVGLEFNMIIPVINFPIYGIIVVLSIIIGMIYVYCSLKKEGYKKNILLYFLMYISFSFVLGKIFTIVTSSENISFIDAGLSSYGGVIGVILAAFIFEKILPTNKNVIK